MLRQNVSALLWTIFENVGNAFPVFSTFFLCANQTNYTVYNELCTIYILHTIISALYFSRRETQNFAFTAWAGALSFIAKNVADGLFSVCMMTKAQESCSYSQPMILRFYHFTYELPISPYKQIQQRIAHIRLPRGWKYLQRYSSRRQTNCPSFQLWPCHRRSPHSGYPGVPIFPAWSPMLPALKFSLKADKIFP